MDNKKGGRFSIGAKMYLFITSTIFIAAMGTALISYFISAGQINRFYQSTTLSVAKNFASMLDPVFLAELKAMAMTDEYQSVRAKAEENEDEETIREYLQRAGLWERYSSMSGQLNSYLDNTDIAEYLYILVASDPYAGNGIMLMDDDENPIYITGQPDYDETEFYGVDTSGVIEPTISDGEWGWLCSAYAPVYAEDGTVICHVGCDVSMDEVMEERHQLILAIIIGALAFTAAVLANAVLLVNKAVVKPLKLITKEMKKFKPAEKTSYEEAGVISLNIRSRDEIEDIYQDIRSMQTNIIDYLNNMYILQRDKEKAENDVREKDEQIGAISLEAYRDALTGVGSKTAYNRKVAEINAAIAEGQTEFSIVMVDMNNLKKINDEYGHKAGDQYIIGCCRMICDAFKHSPVFRIGGDEFIAILQGMDYAERKGKVDALRREYTAAYENKGVMPWQRYSASVGIAECASDDNSFDLMFKRADEAMYEEKLAFKEKYGSYR
ncbi:MAG: diguanylate cyclase [Lachnospiraceae bacterium]|nr:diguanylate cyclase [Lachnospiraceae bacterium]